MTDERSEHTASTPEDLSSVEIIDDLRAENEQLRARLQAMDASEARDRLRSCTTKDEAERICNGMLATIDFQRAEIERYVTEIDSMVVHQEYEALAIDDLRTDLAAKDATIAAQAAEIERLKKLPGLWEKMAKHRAERMDVLRAMIRSRDAELAALRSQLEEQRKGLDVETH